MSYANNVWRLALLWFQLSDRQRPMMLTGLVLTTVGCLSPRLVGFIWIGVTLIVGVPAVFGGLVLRALSGSKTFVLRPHAAALPLCATQLVIMLCSLLMLLANWVPDTLGWTDWMPSSHVRRGLLAALLHNWSTLSLLWAAMFVAVTPRQYFGRYGVAITLLIGIGTYMLLDRLLLTPLQSRGAWLQPAVAAAAWLLICLWLLQPRALIAPALRRHFTHFLYAPSPLALDSGRSSRDCAICAHLLRHTSWLTPAQEGLLYAALLLLIDASAVARVFSVFAIVSALWPLYLGLSRALTASRHARVLWLRAGLSRTDLFRLTEQQVTRATLITGATAILPLLVLGLWRGTAAQPLLSAFILIMTASITAQYLGLALVRGRSRNDLLQFIVAVVAWIGMAISLLAGDLDHIVSYLPCFTALLAGAAALRALALHRWKTLDWHSTHSAAAYQNFP
jgi:hypothetical protein